jgi:hypothetical protein
LYPNSSGQQNINKNGAVLIWLQIHNLSYTNRHNTALGSGSKHDSRTTTLSQKRLRHIRWWNRLGWLFFVGIGRFLWLVMAKQAVIH